MNHGQSKQELHHSIGIYIKSHSQAKFPKKHGGWHVYHVTPTLWFWMDDFNWQISLHWGEPPTQGTHNRPDNCLCYLGIDFGGYESKLTREQYLEVAGLLK
jgi:hypothetical protein